MRPCPRTRLQDRPELPYARYSNVPDGCVLSPRVLDAGAGFDMATFALLDALRALDIDAQAIDAFDLTPAMLDRFQAELDSQGITLVRHKRANVRARTSAPVVSDMERLRPVHLSLHARVRA